MASPILAWNQRIESSSITTIHFALVDSRESTEVQRITEAARAPSESMRERERR